MSDAELQRLSDEMTQRLEDNLREESFSAQELNELAERQRSLAHVTDSAGQRRALLDLAEHYERAARERSAVRG